MKVFVYGTLKHGHGNHRILAHLEKEKNGVLLNHKLYDAGFPVCKPNEGTSVLVRSTILVIASVLSIVSTVLRVRVRCTFVLLLFSKTVLKFRPTLVLNHIGHSSA